MTLLLAVVLPLAGAALVAAVDLGRRISALVTTASVALALGASLAMLGAFAQGRTALVAELGAWLPIRGADLSLRVEPATLALLIATTAVALLAALAHAGGSAAERPTRRSLVALGLVTSGVALLLTASNLILLLAAAQLAGIGSYLLAAHRQERAAAADAGMRVAVVGRIGDVALLLGILGFSVTFSTTDLGEIAQRFAPPLADDARARLAAQVLVPSALVLVGAMARAGQPPFHGWLVGAPDVPPAASALIHTLGCGTGVLLLLRLGAILHPGALAAAIVVGALGAAGGALAGLGAPRLRDVLAWSTVSQTGLMFVLVGMTGGAALAGGALFTAHALAKTAVIVAAAQVRAATDDEDELRRLGGLGRRLPWNALAFAIGAASLAALPPTAGFAATWLLAAGLGERPLLGIAIAAALALGALALARTLRLVYLGAASAVVAPEARRAGILPLVPSLVAAGLALVYGPLLLAGPWSPVLASLPVQGALLVAALGLSGVVAGLALGARLERPLGAAADRARRVARPLDLVPAAFGSATRLLETGSESAIEGAGVVIASAIPRLGALASRLETRYARLREAILFATAVALLAYWTLR